MPRAAILSFVGRGVSLTRPVLQFVLSFVGRGVSYTPRAAKCFVVRRYESLSYTTCAESCLVGKRIRGLSYTTCVGICLVHRRLRNLSYTPSVTMSCFRFVRVSLTYRVMGSVSSFGGWGWGWGGGRVGGRGRLQCPVLESVLSFSVRGVPLTSRVLETV